MRARYVVLHCARRNTYDFFQGSDGSSSNVADFTCYKRCGYPNNCSILAMSEQLLNTTNVRTTAPVQTWEKLTPQQRGDKRRIESVTCGRRHTDVRKCLPKPTSVRNLGSSQCAEAQGACGCLWDEINSRAEEKSALSATFLRTALERGGDREIASSLCKKNATFGTREPKPAGERRDWKKEVALLEWESNSGPTPCEQSKCDTW
jgi:hypothetical protein